MSVHQQGRAVGRHWVVIETGGNQAYVFASNRQATNVGASELIARAGTAWVHDAAQMVRSGPGAPPGVWVDEVVSASGKALLLVDSERTGRRIIRAVTERALHDAPGLDIWGVVDPRPIVCDAEVGQALAQAYRHHAAVRSRRPPVQLRHPTLPFTQPCRYSGGPATALEKEGELTAKFPRSAGIDAAWRARNRGRDRMASELSETAVVQPTRLNNGVNHAGWVAVVHADGNGIGEVFRNLPSAYAGDIFLDRLAAFSSALAAVTAEALRRAVGTQPDLKDWVLPLVLGGDDMTAMMHARVAYPVTVEFLRQFAVLSARNEAITEVVARTGGTVGPGRAGLSACAGIVFVKPQRSFAEAYQIAEALCTSAKQVKTVAPGVGAVDCHVLHDSVGRSIAKVREPLTVTSGNGGQLRLWAGPIVVTESPRLPGREELPWLDDTAAAWVRTRHESRLRDAMHGLRPGRGLLSRTAMHTLRAAMLESAEATQRAREQVLAWVRPDPGADATRRYLDEHLWVADPPGTADPPAVTFSRLVTAIDLLDMEAGTAGSGGAGGATGDAAFDDPAARDAAAGGPAGPLAVPR